MIEVAAGDMTVGSTPVPSAKRHLASAVLRLVLDILRAEGARCELISAVYYRQQR